MSPHCCFNRSSYVPAVTRPLSGSVYFRKIRLSANYACLEGGERPGFGQSRRLPTWNYGDMGREPGVPERRYYCLWCARGAWRCQLVGGVCPSCRAIARSASAPLGHLLDGRKSRLGFLSVGASESDAMCVPSKRAEDQTGCGELSDSSSVIREAKDRLRQCGFRELSAVICEFDGRGQVLTLRGRASSYFVKQVAQESVRRIKQIKHVVNLLEVAKPDSEDRQDGDSPPTVD